MLIDILATLALTLATHRQPVLPTKLAFPVVVTPNFDTDVVEPLKAAQPELAAKRAAIEEEKRKSDCEAAGGTYSDNGCVYPPPPSNVAYTGLGSLVAGTYGYSHAWGNCVLEAGVNNPGWGNPINWPALYSQPHLGATVLFTWNHTGVVAGIYSNGDIEVRQQNSGGSSRIPAYEVRGYR